MLRLTDYTVTIAPGQQRTFGYGGIDNASGQGTIAYRSPDVPFQSQTMSPLCFSIAKHDDGTYWIKGLDDRLQLGGELIEANQETHLANKVRFKTVGEYGGAVFTAFLDEDQPGEIRLQLQSPIYYTLASHQTRVTFGSASDIVRSPIDELVIRTALKDRPTETILIEKRMDAAGFIAKEEVDLADSSTKKSEVLDSLSNGKAATKTGEVSLESPSTAPVGTVRVLFSGHGSLFGVTNAAKLFGFKFSLAVILVAIAFGFRLFGSSDAQVPLPSGSIIFGCVTVFAAVGLSLAARDYLHAPFNQERFPLYEQCIVYSLAVLYLIRIPLQKFWTFRWLWALPLFLLVNVLLARPFDGFFAFPSVLSIVAFGFAYIALAFVAHYVMSFVIWFAATAITGNWMRVMLSLAIPAVIIIIFTRLMGGREAFHFGSFRIHLPTLFLPVLVFATALTVVITEKRDTGWIKPRSYGVLSMLGIVLLYYLASGRDHGGAAVLSVGVFATMWAASTKRPPWVLSSLSLVLLGAVTYVGTVYGQQQRLDIAWGGEEGVLRYFDQAVNLRTGRDLARAGGIFGLYDKLYVPSTVSMNIHNDLVTAYIAGFFGLLGLTIVVAAYFLFYTRLIGGIRDLVPPKLDNQKAAKQDNGGVLKRGQVSSMAVKPDDVKPSIALEEIRRVFVAYSRGIAAVFLFQFVWVFAATLWRRIPFTGLDLQPISASAISVLSFIIVLLGSVIFVRNACQSEHEAIRPSGSSITSQAPVTRIPRRGELT